MENATASKRSALLQTCADVPGALVAAFGLNCAIIAAACLRLSTLRVVDSGGNYHAVAAIAATLLLAGAALLYRRNPAPFHAHAMLLMWTNALLFSVSIFAALNQGIVPSVAPVREVAYALVYFCSGMLLFGWTAYLLPFGAKHVAVIYSMGLLFAGVTYLMISFLQVPAGVSVVAMTPLVSAGCFGYFREYSLFRRDLSSKRFPVDDGDMDFRIDESVALAVRGAGERYAVALATLCVPIFCYALMFGQVHYQWTIIQDQSTTSLIVQLGAGAGTACAGALLLLFIQTVWSRHTIELVNLLLPPLVILSLYLSAYLGAGSAFFYLMLLDATHKLVLFFIMIAPFVLVDREHMLMPWCVAYICFNAGIAASSVVLEHPSPLAFSICTIVSLAVLLACIVVFQLSSSQVSAEVAHTNAESSNKNETGAVAASSAAREPQGNKLARACTQLASTYHLTARETEVLGHLAHGHTAQSIADALVLSPSTAKTHIRNIYGKMDVHSQQELLQVVEATIDELRNEDRS